jgi:hypothetical protein
LLPHQAGEERTGERRNNLEEEERLSKGIFVAELEL